MAMAGRESQPAFATSRSRSSPASAGRGSRSGAVLELGVGQVIELDRQVGAPIDIIANNDVVIARGEVVEVDDEYGVRITEVVHGALD